MSRYLYLVLFAFFIAPGAYSDFVGPDKTPKYDYRSILDIVKNPIEGAAITLRGYIIEKVNHNTYLFSDNTGKVVVYIKDRSINGINLNPTTLVEINGKVHKARHRKVEIRTKSIQVINSPGVSNTSGVVVTSDSTSHSESEESAK